jgi:hypothetical protein
MGEERLKGIVSQMKVQPAGIGAHFRTPPAQQLPQGQAHLFRKQIPHRMLQRLIDRNAAAALVATARAGDAMGQRPGLLPVQTGPDLNGKDARQFGLIGQRREERLHETQAHPPCPVDQFQRGEMDIVRPHLAVTDHAVPRELKSSDTKSTIAIFTATIDPE